MGGIGLGSYDILEDSKNKISCQVKTFYKRMRVFKIGDKLPIKEGNYPSNFTILLPAWEGCNFVIVKNGCLYKLTNSKRGIIKPFYSKWGKLLLSDFNPSYRITIDLDKQKEEWRKTRLEYYKL